MKRAELVNLARGVLTVGGGRGYVVEMPRRNKAFPFRERVIITAAHCLPHLPPAHPWAFPHERTYSRLLGPLNTEEPPTAWKPTVWAECYFVDPVADLAVLGTPDNQELCDEADAYDALMEEAVPLRIGAMPYDRPRAATLLALTGEWFRCRVSSYSNGGRLSISEAAQDIVGGMSGSPIIDVKNGFAVGVMCVTSGSLLQPTGHREGGPNPFLRRDLPSWMLRRNY